MRLSLHARDRWRERCGSLDIDWELKHAKGASKRVMRMLPRADQREGYTRYMVTPGQVVLVMGEDWTIVTVFMVADVKVWTRRRAAEARRYNRWGTNLN